jgi:hypothetical protein
VNNQSYKKVKYVHASIDIYFLPRKEKKMNLLLISSSQKKKCPHTSISKSVYTQTKGKKGINNSNKESNEPNARTKINK